MKFRQWKRFSRGSKKERLMIMITITMTVVIFIIKTKEPTAISRINK